MSAYSIPNATYRFHAKSVLQQPELQALEAGGAGEVFPEVHKVQWSHCLEDVNLVDQDLKRGNHSLSLDMI